MRLRFISAPAIILGAILLASFVLEIYGPVSVSSTPTTDVLISVESTVPHAFTGIAGALLLISGLAIEARVRRWDSQDIADDKNKNA
ncbi:MAG: hypothetical protein HZA31_06330 [Opitutae bacterium]|nr:hypothetical protein [Opitutae bacterium]